MIRVFTEGPNGNCHALRHVASSMVRNIRCFPIDSGPSVGYAPPLHLSTGVSIAALGFAWALSDTARCREYIL